MPKDPDFPKQTTAKKMFDYNLEKDDDYLDYHGHLWPYGHQDHFHSLKITQRRDGLCQRQDYPDNIFVQGCINFIQRKKITSWKVMALDLPNGKQNHFHGLDTTQCLKTLTSRNKLLLKRCLTII